MDRMADACARRRLLPKNPLVLERPASGASRNASGGLPGFEREASTTCGRGAASGRRRPRQNAAAVCGACAAWRLRRGRYYLSNAADAGFARRPPFWPLYDGRGAVSKWDAARRPGGRGRPASAGPSTGARGLSPCPMHLQRGRRAVRYVFFSFRMLRGTGVSRVLVFGLPVSLQAASWRISRKPETHSLPAAFAITHVRRGALHQLLRLVVQFRCLARSALVCSQQLRAQTTAARNSKQKCPTF